MLSSRPPRRPTPREPDFGSPEDELSETDAQLPDPEASDPHAAGAGDSPPDSSESALAAKPKKREPVALAPDESAYRWERLTARTLIDRIERRYRKDLGGRGLSPDDFMGNVHRRAYEALDFPDQDTPMFPWVYRHANSELQQLCRRQERERERFVAADDVAEQAAPEPSALSEEDQRLMDLVERKTANDSGARRAVTAIGRRAAGETYQAIANDWEEPAPRLRQQVFRVVRELKSAAGRGGRAGAATALAVVLLAAYGAYDLRRHGMDVSHDTVPVAVRTDPMPVPPVPDDTSVRLAGLAARDEALKACNARQWAECLNGLTRAKDVDPLLAEDPIVVKAQQAAETALNRKAP